MAVARQSKIAAKMPNHMPCAAMGAPYADWMKKVSHRKAPGAISAIALTVSPVKPRVEGGFGVVGSGDIELLLRALRAVALVCNPPLGGRRPAHAADRPLK